jgi:hypothetical protein
MNDIGHVQVFLTLVPMLTPEDLAVADSTRSYMVGRNGMGYCNVLAGHDSELPFAERAKRIILRLVAETMLPTSNNSSCSSSSSSDGLGSPSRVFQRPHVRVQFKCDASRLVASERCCPHDAGGVRATTIDTDQGGYIVNGNNSSDGKSHVTPKSPKNPKSPKAIGSEEGSESSDSSDYSSNISAAAAANYNASSNSGSNSKSSNIRTGWDMARNITRQCYLVGRSRMAMLAPRLKTSLHKLSCAQLHADANDHDHVVRSSKNTDIKNSNDFNNNNNNIDDSPQILARTIIDEVRSIYKRSLIKHKGCILVSTVSPFCMSSGGKASRFRASWEALFPSIGWLCLLQWEFEVRVSGPTTPYITSAAFLCGAENNERENGTLMRAVWPLLQRLALHLPNDMATALSRALQANGLPHEFIDTSSFTCPFIHTSIASSSSSPTSSVPLPFGTLAMEVKQP